MKPTNDTPACERLSFLMERFAWLISTSGQSAGLRPVHWEVLRFLAKANRFSRSPGALTEYLGSTKGTVSQTVQALERRGLVARQSVAGDGRAVELNLTAGGEEALRNDPIAMLEAVVAGLAPTDRQEIERILEAVLKGLLDRRGRKPFGICRECRYLQTDRDGNHHCGLLDVALEAADTGQLCHEYEAA
jgi:DNA-binding MarR family transcriptional regulator